MVGDRVLAASGAEGHITVLNVPGAPAVVVEIPSPATRHRDATLKRERYGSLGVSEYRMVDTNERGVRVVGWHPDSKRRVYVRFDSTGSGDTTQDLKEARIFLKGSVKWDGCCNWQFEDDGALHLCGADGLSTHLNRLKAIYLRCGHLMNQYAESCDMTQFENV